MAFLVKVLESEKIQELNIYHFATVFNARMAAQYFFIQSPFLSLACKYIRLNDPLLYNCLFHHQFLFNLPFHSNKGTQEKCDHCRKKNLIYTVYFPWLSLRKDSLYTSKTKDPCKLRTENVWNTGRRRLDFVNLPAPAATMPPSTWPFCSEPTSAYTWDGTTTCRQQV